MTYTKEEYLTEKTQIVKEVTALRDGLTDRILKYMKEVIEESRPIAEELEARKQACIAKAKEAGLSDVRLVSLTRDELESLISSIGKILDDAE